MAFGALRHIVDRKFASAAVRRGYGQRASVTRNGDVGYARLRLPHLTCEFADPVANNNFHDRLWIVRIEKRTVISSRRKCRVFCDLKRFPGDSSSFHIKRRGPNLIRVFAAGSVKEEVTGARVNRGG